jgi:hypothetical protein
VTELSNPLGPVKLRRARIKQRQEAQSAAKSGTRQYEVEKETNNKGKKLKRWEMDR